MNTRTNERLVFLTLARSKRGKQGVRLLIDSLRSFGGEMSACPVWVFAAKAEETPCADLEGPLVQVIPLETPPTIRAYLFSDKVAACARAEELAPGHIQSLVWIDPNCLVTRPPLLFDLGTTFDAAVRPVHIRNVGLPARGPVDAYWQGIYAAFGRQDIPGRVDSFVDGEHLRAYYNSHAFAIRPGRGLMRRWLEKFERLVCDEEFQQHACQDEPHQVFLFQAVLSTLLDTAVTPARLRVLPPVYNYPYNLQNRIPAARRVEALDDLACFTYEERSLNPEDMTDIGMREGLRSWLSARFFAEEKE